MTVLFLCHCLILKVKDQTHVMKDITANDCIIATVGIEDANLDLVELASLEEFRECNILNG